MKVYVIDGKEKIGKTEFSTILAKKISKNIKTLIIGINRSEKTNIEDLFQKDGMITYDLCDYFLDYVDLKTIINKANDKLDFIISPFINGKYEITKEDIEKLLDNLDYENVIFDGLNPDLLKENTTIQLIDQNDVEINIKSDYFFINKAKSDFDPRLLKEELRNKDSKYLGFVNEKGSYNNILDNLLNEKEEIIPNIGFFEKIKMKFKS